MGKHAEDRELKLADDDDDYDFDDSDEFEEYEEYDDDEEEDEDWDDYDDDSSYGGRQKMMRRSENRFRNDDFVDWSRYSDHDRW